MAKLTRKPLPVLINRDLHDRLAKEAIDEDDSIVERLHWYLCHAMERPDLLAQPPVARPSRPLESAQSQAR